MSQIHLVQIETIWQGMLRETQQPDMDWSWAYRVHLKSFSVCVIMTIDVKSKEKELLQQSD